MLNGRGITFSVPAGYTLAKFRRDKKQAHAIDRMFQKLRSSSVKIRDYSQLLYSLFGI